MKYISAKSISFYALALAIPCLVVMAVFFGLAMYPFGDRTLSTWDLQITYTYFYEWFREVLSGNGNIFYSFSKSLGGNMFAGWACLLASPINWLVVFFGQNPMDFVTFMIVAKFGLAGLTSYFYINKRFKLSQPLTLALSICYSMMLFMTTQSANPMWMDAVIVLPLVLYGIFCLVHQGKVIFFFVSLTASIILNFYNGYMICIYSVLFYLFECFLAAPGRPDVRLKLLIKPGRFIITYGLAVLTSAFVLAPTVIGLLAGKGAVPGGLFTLEFRYDFLDVFRSFYLGVYEKENLPQLYSGMLTLISVLWFFINQKISKREKIATAVFIALMVLSTWFAPLDRIWLGLRDGTSFYCRFTFLVSALLIFTAARSLQTLDAKSTQRLLIAAAIVAVGAIVFAINQNYMRSRYFFPTIIACIALPVLLLLIYRYRKQRAVRNILNCLLVLAVVCEAVISCWSVLLFRLDTNSPSSYQRYGDYYAQGHQAIQELTNSDGGVYRLEKTYNFLSPYRRIALNESLAFGYRGVALYDSAYDDHVQNFLTHLGYTPDNNIITGYNEPMIISDSLLGIKYVASKYRPADFADSTVAANWDGGRIYQNPYALPLGYGASRDILQQIDFTGDPFDYQNKLLNALLGTNQEYLIPVAVSLKERGAREWVWEVEAPPDQTVYGFFEYPRLINADLYEAGVYKMIYLNDWSQGMFQFTSEAVDGKRTVSLKGDIPPNATDLILDACYIDMEAFAQARDVLAAQPLEFTSFADGIVEASYQAKADSTELLFTTIPYDSGWTVKLNGSVIEPYQAQGIFMAFEVLPGNNTIEMSYVSPGFIPGLAVSVSACALFIGFAIYWSKKSRFPLAQSRKSDIEYS